jgi:hypothetical protein
MWRAAAADKAADPQLVGTVPKPGGNTVGPDTLVVKYTVPGGPFFSDEPYLVLVPPIANGPVQFNAADINHASDVSAKGGVKFRAFDAPFDCAAAEYSALRSHLPDAIDVPPQDRPGRVAAAVVLTPVTVGFDVVNTATLGMFWWTDGFGTGVSSQTPGLH